MTTYLGKSCSFGLPRVPFVNCGQFMYLVISLLVLRAGCGIWLYQFLIIAYLFTLQLMSYTLNSDIKQFFHFASNSAFSCFKYFWLCNHCLNGSDSTRDKILEHCSVLSTFHFNIMKIGVHKNVSLVIVLPSLAYLYSWQIKGDILIECAFWYQWM